MSKKIKVLMVGALPLDLQSVRGGVEAATLNLFSGICQLEDIEVVHVSFIKDAKEKREISYARNVRICFVPFKINIRLLDYFINGELKKIISNEQPDIIHIQESEPHLIRFLGISKNNVVVTQHGIMKEELKYVDGLNGKLKFLFKSLIERYLFPSFKNFIFISNYNKNLFKGKWERSCNIYNCVNPIFFDHVSAKPAANNSIIYVGVISHRKNIRILIEALRVLKNQNIIYQLHIVGSHKKNELAYYKEIISLIEEYGLSKQITHHGWLKQDDILKVYDQCSCFVLPSLQETLPISLAEAMALGKTVIASDVGAVSEMFKDKVEGYLFKRNDVNELVGLLELLDANQKTKKDSWAQIKATAIEKYHPLKNARLTVDFYKEILASRGVTFN